MPTFAPHSLWRLASHLWLSATSPLLLLFLLSAPPIDGAESSLPSTTTPPAAQPLFTDQEWANTPAAGERAAAGTGLASIVISLVVVTALAVGLGLLVRRIGLQRLNTPRGRHMEVIDQLALGPKRTVCLLRVADQVLVLGHGEHGITHLASVSADGFTPTTASPVPVLPPSAATPSTAPGTENDAAAAFRAALARATGRTSTP